MGAGIAKQVRDRFPGIDWTIGQEILDMTDDWGRYGTIIGGDLGVFQVKTFWGNKADLGLIQYSAECLNWYAHQAPENRFDLNFPGIGNGQLNYDDVFPLIADLPDNVHIWTF